MNVNEFEPIGAWKGEDRLNGTGRKQDRDVGDSEANHTMLYMGC